jgi:hypothetical protein
LVVGTALSLGLFVAAGGLWLLTGTSRRVDTIIWGRAGEYRMLEFSGDDAEYRVLRDPGLPATPAQWRRQPSGWVPPPKPSKPVMRPPGAVTWILPGPEHRKHDVFDQGGRPASPTAFKASSVGGIRSLGLEHATFDGWYGAGTTLTSYRFSYFLVMLPAAILTSARSRTVRTEPVAERTVRAGPLSTMWLRPPRHAGSLPGVRPAAAGAARAADRDGRREGDRR